MAVAAYDLAFLAGDSEMARRMRDFDWTKTVLGPPQGWPSALRVAVRVLLNTRHPVYIFWGEHGACLYNDAYRQSIGPERHPASLGQPARQVWEEIWPIIGPQIDQVMAGHGATWHENALVPITRDGRYEDVYWTYSYGPIDDATTATGVGGVLVLCTETTEQVINARRLKEAEERLDLALSAGDGIGTWDWDIVNDRLVADARFARLFGVAPERAAAGAPASEFFDGIHPDDQARIKAAVAATQVSGGDFIAEYRVAPDGGTVRWVRAQGVCLFDADGRPLRFPGAAFDITVRKEADKLRDALVNFSDAVRDLDNAEDIAYAACRILGETLAVSRVGFGTVDLDAYTLSVGRDYIAPGVASFTGVMPLVNYDAFLDDAKAGKVIVVTDAMTDPRNCAHGAAWTAAAARAMVNIPVIEQGSLVALLFVNDAGARQWCPATLGFIEDVAQRTRAVTERARVTEALRASETRLRTVNTGLAAQVEERTRELSRTWEVIPDLLAVARPDAGFVSSNPAWADHLGWAAQDVQSAAFFDFVHPDDLAAAHAAWDGALAGDTQRFESRYECKSGEWRWMSWIVVPDAGKLYCSARDVTMQKQAEADLARMQGALRQSQKMEAVGQLTGGIAHDFNNMLAVVIGSLDLLNRRIGGDDVRAKHYVTAAMEGAKRAANLTQRLLAFSRQQPLRPEAINPNRLVSGMSELLTHALGASVRLDAVLATGVWWVSADPNQLENVILNLGVNARDAMPDGGRLTIETRNVELDDHVVAEQPGLAAGPYVMIAVSDTGTGMPPDVLARAFEPFFTTKAVGKGTGLGLSQVYGFVKQSGGHISIDTEAGQGTSVNIYLPRLEVAEAERIADQDQDELPVDGHREIILVVDDEDVVRQFSIDALEELGYRVLSANGATEALRLIDSHPEIALLFTDIVMPQTNGRKLAEAVHARRPDVRVLFTTGYARDAIQQQGIDSDVELIGKPFTIDDLAVRVRQVLERSS